MVLVRRPAVVVTIDLAIEDDGWSPWSEGIARHLEFSWIRRLKARVDCNRAIQADGQNQGCSRKEAQNHSTK
jgi:hypothetical protein